MAIALVYASSVPGLADPDAFAHLRYATELWRSGLRLQGHPYLPFTVLGDSNVDPWLAFHWLMLPLVPFGILWGARIAGACIAAAVAGTLAILLCKLGRRTSWPFAIAPLLLSFPFALRGHVARPAHLTIPLILIELCCGISLLSPAWAFGAAFVHGLLHLSSPISPVFALLGSLVAWATKKWGGKPSPRAVLWSGAGLGLALIVRPDRADYSAIAIQHNLLALGFGSSGHLPHTGAELLRAPAGLLFSQSWPLLVLVAAALIAGWRSEKSGAVPARAAAFAAAILSILLTLRAQRFIDYAGPFLALCAGLVWPRMTFAECSFARAPRAARLVALGLASLAGLFFLQLRGQQIGRALPPLFDEPATYAGIEAAVRARVPPGATIFTDDPFATEILYSALPEYRYIDAYDPAFLYIASPKAFWRWHNAIAFGFSCENPSCPGPMSPAGVAEVLDSFDARWVITSYPHGGRSIQEAMASDATRFDLAKIVPGSSNGLYLWHLHK